MRRVLTTVLAVALLLGLGALAVLALPNGSAPLAGAPAVSAAAPEFQDAPEVPTIIPPFPEFPAAPAAAQNYNAIALPLDSSAQFTYNSQGLAAFVGPSVVQVLRLDANLQQFDTWNPATQDGSVGGSYTDVPWAVSTGGVYWILVNSSAPPVVSFVGNVPAQGSIKFTLVGASPACKYNSISVPLDQGSITNSQQLATSIGASNVAQILRLDATRQGFDTWNPATQDGSVGGGYTDVPWEVKIGYPYWVCLASGANNQVWP